MKKLVAALILAAAGSSAFAAELGLSGVSENLAPQLEAAAAPMAGPEVLGQSGENISVVLQGGQGLSQVSAVEAAPFAAPRAAVAALAPARAGEAFAAPVVAGPFRAAPNGRPKSAAFEIVAVLLLLAASAMSYYAICHAFSEVAGKAFSQDEPTSIEQVLPR